MFHKKIIIERRVRHYCRVHLSSIDKVRECGLTANGNLQLLDANNEPIKGLYGAGELVGGVHGDKALSLLTWGMTSGYYVGQNLGTV